MMVPGVNVIKVLHLYFTRVAIVSLTENNSCTCKLQVENFHKIDPRILCKCAIGYEGDHGITKNPRNLDMKSTWHPAVKRSPSR